MDSLFRFMVVRPPSAVSSDRFVSLHQNSSFQRTLRTSAGNPGAIRQKARNFVADVNYIDSVSGLGEADTLRGLGIDLRIAAANPAFDVAAARDMAVAALGGPIEDLLGNADFRRGRRNLVDSIVAIKLVRTEHNKAIADLANVLRVIAFLEDLDANLEYLQQPGVIGSALNRPLQVPQGIFPLETLNAALRPAGIADLLIVKQQLVRYERNDIAHVENVLSGESKVREHRRKTTIEESITTEVETTTEEERELESTERFEMQREVAETIQHDTSLEAGLKVTGRYGPFVEFEANAGVSVNDSSERSSTFAASYASELTSRSAQKVTERFKQQRTRRVVSEVEESNRHELVGGRDHIIGIYQWLNKVYEAQIFNYGSRTMFDFMIPEPAAYLTRVMEGTKAAGPQPPPPLTLTPDQLDDQNWPGYVAQYHASGVNPPPAATRDVSKTFDFAAQEAGGQGNPARIASAQLAVDDDYATVSAWVDIVRTNDTPRGVRVSIGATTQEF